MEPFSTGAETASGTSGASAAGPGGMIGRAAADLLQVYGERDLMLVKGRGSHVWDSEGRRYLDCVGGIAVNALGHGFPAVLEAVRRQAEDFLHVGSLYLQAPQLELARLLKECTGMDRVFFCNSGAEANEGALKFARRHRMELAGPDCHEIIGLSSSFHGRTYGALAATGQEKLKSGFGPMPAGFRTVPVNDAQALRGAVSGRTAAVIFEPILAEGGIISLSGESARVLAELQSEGVLLISDEVQTGLCRTGPFLASSRHGLRPDIVTLAKPLGGGLPLGAVLLGENVALSIRAGDHGSTFGGNPVACAAGAAVVRELIRPEFARDMRRRSDLLRAGLDGLLRDARWNPAPGALRGEGFLLGFPLPGDIPAFLKSCRGHGLLAYKAGTDVVRLLPPLNLGDGEIAELLAALASALVQYAGPGRR